MRASPQVLQSIAGQYDTPTYVLFQDVLEESFADLDAAFKKAWGNTQIAYSYKTNSLMQVCKLFHSMGAWAEVTSGLEYSMAKRLLIPGNNIVFNGPYKSQQELEIALSEHSLVNIDNFGELVSIEAVCRNLHVSGIEVGIRVVSSANSLSWDKFGFDIDNGEALQAAKTIANSAFLRLAGLHGHFRSNIMDLMEYRVNISSLVGFARHLANEDLMSIKYLDIGSGIATTQPVLASAQHWQPPTFGDYAEAAAACLRECKIHHQATLVIEPGRSITSNAGLLLTRVVAVKNRRDRNLVIVDAGINMVPGLPMYKYRINKVSERHNSKTRYEVQGCLCEKLDVLGEAMLEEVHVGDLLMIESVGAYDMAGRSFTFIRPKPQVIWVDSMGSFVLIRRGETIEDQLRTQTWW